MFGRWGPLGGAVHLRHRERSLVVPCPLTWHRGAATFLRQRIGVFYVVVACPLTCHLRHSRVFFRQRIGVAADAATRAECHVNGHGTTTRPHPLTLPPAEVEGWPSAILRLKPRCSPRFYARLCPRCTKKRYLCDRLSLSGMRHVPLCAPSSSHRNPYGIKARHPSAGWKI